MKAAGIGVCVLCSLTVPASCITGPTDRAQPDVPTGEMCSRAAPLFRQAGVLFFTNTAAFWFGT
jgi:hypothetical protein